MQVYEDLTEQAPCFSFYFRQILAGPHDNFVYVVGCPVSRQACIIDPAFELDRVFEIVARDGYKIRHAFFTHGHWDHIGGIPKIFDLGVQSIHIHGVARTHPKVLEAAAHDVEVFHPVDGEALKMGSVKMEWLHTPGHQPESSCILTEGEEGPRALFGGDTLFVGSCGRTDFPGGDTDAMFASMARLRDMAASDIFVMPGHHYAEETTRPLTTEVVDNPALATIGREAFGELHCLTN